MKTKRRATWLIIVGIVKPNHHSWITVITDSLTIDRTATAGPDRWGIVGHCHIVIRWKYMGNWPSEIFWIQCVANPMMHDAMSNKPCVEQPNVQQTLRSAHLLLNKHNVQQIYARQTPCWTNSMFNKLYVRETMLSMPPFSNMSRGFHFYDFWNQAHRCFLRYEFIPSIELEDSKMSDFCLSYIEYIF